MFPDFTPPVPNFLKICFNVFRKVLDLTRPLKFECYDHMKFVYEAYLELLEMDLSTGQYLTRRKPWEPSGFTEDDRIWEAFSSYFQQRRQRGDSNKLLKSRLIVALGGRYYVKQLKRRAKIYRGKYWMSLYEPRKIPTVHASTQTDDNDLV